MSSNQKNKDTNDPNYKTNHGRENVFNPEKAKVKLLPLEDTPIPNDNGNII